MKLIRYTFILLVLLINIQITTYAEEVDLGELKGSTYHNNYFGFTLQIPPSWQTLDKQTTSQIYSKAKDLVLKNDDNLKSKMEQNDPTYLLWLSKYPIGKTLNPNLSIVTQDLKGAYDITRGKQLFDKLKSQLDNTAGLQFEVIKESEEKIGGFNFDSLELQANIDKDIVRVKYSVTIFRGHAIILNSAYFSEKEFQELETIIRSINFDRWLLIEEDNGKKTYLDTSEIAISGDYISCWLMTEAKYINLSVHALIKKPNDFNIMEMVWHNGKESSTVLPERWQSKDSNPKAWITMEKCIRWVEEHNSNH